VSIQKNFCGTRIPLAPAAGVSSPSFSQRPTGDQAWLNCGTSHKSFSECSFWFESFLEFCILLAMGMFDQLKAASDLMKNMSPDELSKLMKQAEESKKMLEDTVRKVLEEEIAKRGLVTRDELDKRLSA